MRTAKRHNILIITVSIVRCSAKRMRGTHSLSTEAISQVKVVATVAHARKYHFPMIQVEQVSVDYSKISYGRRGPLITVRSTGQARAKTELQDSFTCALVKEDGASVC